MLGCGPGGILGGILLVLVPQCACEPMGDIMVVTTGLWAAAPVSPSLGSIPKCRSLKTKTSFWLLVAGGS